MNRKWLYAMLFVAAAAAAFQAASFALTASDAAGNAQTVPLTFTLAAAPFTMGPLTPANCLANLAVGQAVTCKLALSGGTPPYKCAVTAGTLPPGLTVTLDASGTSCLVSGTVAASASPSPPGER